MSANFQCSTRRGDMSSKFENDSNLVSNPGTNAPVEKVFSLMKCH